MFLWVGFSARVGKFKCGCEWTLLGILNDKWSKQLQDWKNVHAHVTYIIILLLCIAVFTKIKNIDWCLNRYLRESVFG